MELCSYGSITPSCRSRVLLEMSLQALVGYQLTEEVVRLYSNKKDIGRFHDVAVMLSGRKRSWHAMMNSPSGTPSTVEYIASSQEDVQESEADVLTHAQKGNR